MARELSALQSWGRDVLPVWAVGHRHDVARGAECLVDLGLRHLRVRGVSTAARDSAVADEGGVTPKQARAVLAELDVLARLVSEAQRCDVLTPVGRATMAVALEAMDHQVGYLEHLAGQKDPEPAA